MDVRDNTGLIDQLLNYLKSGEDDFPTSPQNHNASQVKEFIDSLPGGFLIYNADGNEEIIYANRALLRIFRCDTLAQFKILTGNSFKGLVFSEDLAAVEESIKIQIANNADNLDYVEYRIMGRDGAIRWVEDYGHYVQTQTCGNIFYVFITDATEKINRRNSERNLLITERQENEKKLKTLIEEYDKERKLINQEYLRRLEIIEGLSVNYESILYADLDTDKVLPYRLSSRTTLQFEAKMKARGYSAFVKDYVEKWVHPDDRDNVAKMFSPEYIRVRLADSQTFYFNYRSVTEEKTVYLQLRVVDVVNSGHVSQVVIGCRNIDKEILQEIEQKKLLVEALNNAKLASIAKNTFLSNMSHDMRTPLNAIFGYTALAKKNIGDAQTVSEYLDKIDVTGKQILELVEKVLEISYTESQEFHITETPCNICNITDAVYNSILPQARAKKLEVEFERNNIKHPDVFADEDKLKQILMHIASNAVKYTGDGGKISLIIEEKKSKSSEYATFRFAMKDTGMGISEQSLHRIFEPFEREKNSTHSGIFGSGLGLTIAKHIIEMMGGSIKAKSEVNKGSIFTVTLSFRVQNEDNTESAENTDWVLEVLKGKKVLLVEDNEINLEIETEMLEDLELTVEPAMNGKIAVEKAIVAEKDEYFFILMDIQMPVMDGRQAAKAIRKLENSALEGIPIIALSANAFESDKRMSIETGMDAHLTKPIDIPVLLQTLARTLKKRK